MADAEGLLPAVMAVPAVFQSADYPEEQPDLSVGYRFP